MLDASNIDTCARGLALLRVFESLDPGRLGVAEHSPWEVKRKILISLTEGELNDMPVEMVVPDEGQIIPSTGEFENFMETLMPRIHEDRPSNVVQAFRGWASQGIAEPRRAHENRLRKQELRVGSAIELWSGFFLRRFESLVPEIDTSFRVDIPTDVLVIEDTLLRLVRENPRLVHEISHYEFEVLVKQLFQSLGYMVELTSRTRDGGCDLIAFTSDALGIRTKYIVEAKHYGPKSKVDVTVVRQVYAVRQKHAAQHGIIVTSSSFTRDAVKENGTYYGLHLKDYQDLTRWLKGA